MGKGYFAIGVDVDQDYMAPGYVLLSITKKIDIATFEGISNALNHQDIFNLDIN